MKQQPGRMLTFHAPGAVQLEGLLGAALEANRTGRLARFIVDESSPAIALFGAAQRDRNEEGDWYGEHAGKWLAAAAKGARRSGDATLKRNVQRVADFLVNQQDDDGYLGTYAPSRRFMRPQPPGPATWDGAPGVRTWDIWTHSYLILGMIEVHALFAADNEPSRYLECARRIGDLCWRTFTQGGIDVTDLGNHFGMSATVLLDPAVELYFATSDRRYLELAELILEQANGRAELQLLTAALKGTDAAYIGTGKAYQLCWNLVGMAKLHRATGEAALLTAVRNVWESIRAFHLSLGGGPWGGVAHRSREVFNAPGAFSPHGYVETCSTFAWLQLNRELLGITGETRYADEIERSAYNDLLGAQAPNGEDWCYYSFPNGKRVFTTYWRCCKSSGSMALEELPGIACTSDERGVFVNLYGPFNARLSTSQIGDVQLEQRSTYPFDGEIRIVVKPQQATKFSIRLRVPAWATTATVRINQGDASSIVTPAVYHEIERTWLPGDEIALSFAMPPVLHSQSNRNVQESRGPQGEPISQEVMRYDYVAITRGPLVYATGLVDGFRTDETVRLPGRALRTGQSAADPSLEMAPAPSGSPSPAIRMKAIGREPIVFTPYFEAGGRVGGSWRLTWLQLAPETLVAMTAPDVK